AVEDPIARRVGVLGVQRTSRRVHAYAGRCGRLEDAERLLRRGEVARVLEPGPGAREHLQRRPLREAARPGRQAPVELEEVLPRDAAGALAGEGYRFAQQLAQIAVFVTREEVSVGLSERPQPLDLDAL